MSEVVKYPLMTEKAMNLMDFENQLQFVVDLDATKPEMPTTSRSASRSRSRTSGRR